MWFQYEIPEAPAKDIEFYRAEAEKAGFELKKEPDRKLARSMAIETARPGGGLMRVATLAQADGNTMTGRSLIDTVSRILPRLSFLCV